jgi:ribonuclease VapC
VFDSWAILAWLQGESAASQVEELLSASGEDERSASWSSINAGEVYYQLVRRQGEQAADAFWRDALGGGLPLRIYRPTEARVRRAALIKAHHPVAYADAFAMALALELGQPLVTGDHEIREAAPGAGITLQWLR